MKLLPQRCGTCIYALIDQEVKKRDVTADQYLCHGVPPTAQMMPVQVPGGSQFVGMAVRAPVKGNDMACSLYKINPEKLHG